MATTAPTTAPRMTLAAVTRGTVQKPLRVLVYGTEGIGKSTFGADAPAPIFLASEDGTSHLDVARFPQPSTWEDVMEAIRTLTVEAHEYRTLVVDTLDWLEPMCWDYVCRSAKKTSIEDFGFGKGYVAALDEWRRFVAALDKMRERTGMHVILLAHSFVKAFKNPDADVGDFDRYEMKLHAKTAGLLKEWADAVLFAQYETVSKKVGEKNRGVSTGARVVHTERRAAWDAKNRHGLPEMLPLSWEEFYAGTGTRAAGGDVAATRAEVERLITLLPAAEVDTWTKWLASPGASDPRKLAQALDRLKTKTALTTTTSTKENAQ